jgi:hypothetical protein
MHYLAVFIFAFWSAVCQASLIPFVGGKLIYDTDRDITWVADANLCVTLDDCINADANGGMLWADALQWAANLRYLGFSDWRLPTSLELDGSGPCGPGFNCSGSEMGHLFYSELQNTAGVAWNDPGPFSDIQLARYWSSTPAFVNVSGTVLSAWYFWFDFADPSIGLQAAGAQGFEHFGGSDDNLIAWAVRSGRPHGMPEPATLVLLSVGLLVGVFTANRNRRGAPSPIRGVVV